MRGSRSVGHYLTNVTFWRIIRMAEELEVDLICQIKYLVPRLPELVEGHNVEPGAFVARGVERHPHGILL